MTESILCSHEARLRNMTYGFSIHYDVDIIFKIGNDDGILMRAQ